MHLEVSTEQRVDLLTVIECRLFDQKICNTILPTQEPVPGKLIGSPFGWRIDPITSGPALHTGLDFQADVGTPILAAAGDVVIAQQYDAAQGDMAEIDHGSGVVTRYTHVSKVWVKQNELVKRGLKIAEVGTTGRSTGSHLHFEVLIYGIPRGPKDFLLAGENVLALRPAAVPAALLKPVEFGAHYFAQSRR